MSQEFKLSIPNISCHHCTNTIQREAGELPGVLAVEGSVDEKSATFVVDDAGVLTQVRALLSEIGYPATD